MNERFFSFSSTEFFEGVIQPAFQDLIPQEMPFTGTLNEFRLMDNVVTTRTIFDIKRTRNILQRRNATCELIYKQIAGASTRTISVDELAAATTLCKHEFYQGCLKEFRNDDPLFGDKVLPYFKSATIADITSNAYFGDITRTENPASEWSTTKFDGVFKWIRQYYATGEIPASQGMVMPTVNFVENPLQAFNVLNTMYHKQNAYMRAQPNTEKAFYVDQDVLDGYLLYLQQTTGTSAVGVEQYTNGITTYVFNGIPIYVEPIWGPILYELYGENSHAAVLTIRRNFTFGTDKDYGEDSGEVDENGKTIWNALNVWYERKDMQWYYQMFLKAGTQIALPKMIVFALPA